MTDRLSIYNGALRLLGERRLASLTENREPRRLLDDVWDDDGIRACLEAGQWNWATRVQELTYSDSVTPSFGYTYAFEKPTDIVRLTGISSSETFYQPLTAYENTGGFFFADYQNLYIRYVSDDNAYGRDFSLWPETFADFVEAHFAAEIAPKLTASESKAEWVVMQRKRALSDALANDAMGGPSKLPPLGNWANSRLAGRTAWRTRENG